jgi:ATP-dependent 26S proteasome regulatory subunit
MHGRTPFSSQFNLGAGARVTLDMTTLTIMRVLPREVDPLVYNMAAEDPGKVGTIIQALLE